MAYHKRVVCRLCESTQLSLALHYPPQPLADDYRRDAQWEEYVPYPLDLYLCDDCGCAQLLDVVSGDEIYPSYTYETGSSPALVEHFRQYAIDIEARIQPPNEALIVDIGGNDGTLLNFLGIRRPNGRFSSRLLVNVDPSPVKNANKIQRVYNFYGPGVRCQIRRQNLADASIITANNVYANIDDLRTFTENVRNLLTPDGVFVFETFYLADFIDNMVFDFIYHEHLTAFALSPLIGFFQRLGMQVFDVQRVPTKGGSIRVYVQLDTGKRDVTAEVPALVEWEHWRGLGKIDTFKQFEGRILRADYQLNMELAKIKTAGAIIAGYGASPTSTTLIYKLELGRYLDYLIDDWPGKIGTYSPGLHLPVKPPLALGATVTGDINGIIHGPDYCIILAWRYADQIMARNPQYRGTWIVPLPELRVIKAENRNA